MAKENKCTGYCMKCKKKQDMKDPKQSKMKNGRDCVKGTCIKCGTKMFKIGKMGDKNANVKK